MIAEPITPMRAVIAHPHATGVLALHLLLDGEADMEVIGEAGDAEGAGRLARELRAPYLIVHEMLLVDGYPGPLPPETALIVLGMERHPGAAIAARRNGAAAYVQWDRADEDLPGVLRELADQAVFATGR